MARIDWSAPLTIADLAATLPGLSLLIGYLIGLQVSANEPVTTVPLQQDTAQFQTRVFKVPFPHPETEQPKEFAERKVRIPLLGPEGRPLLFRAVRTDSGRGRAIVSQEETDIAVPEIGTPPLEVHRTLVITHPQGSGYLVVPGAEYYELSYALRVRNRGTGVHETRRFATFISSARPERYGVVGGVAGSALSVLYVLLRLLWPSGNNDGNSRRLSAPEAERDVVPPA